MRSFERRGGEAKEMHGGGMSRFRRHFAEGKMLMRQ